jgi:hypothetical protein
LKPGRLKKRSNMPNGDDHASCWINWLPDKLICVAALRRTFAHPWKKRETDVKARLAEYQQRINLLRSRKDLQNEEKKQKIGELQIQLREAERDYGQIYAEIKVASALWQNLITASGKPIDLATIQQALIPPK